MRIVVVPSLTLLLACGTTAAPLDADGPPDEVVAPADAAVPPDDQAPPPVDQAPPPVDQAVPPVDAAAPPDLRVVDLQLPPALVFHAVGDLIDASPDETDNLWAVSYDALHILQAGRTQWRRYTNADGLHIFSFVTAVAGGGVNEGWVGLEGFESDFPDNDSDAMKRVGKLEHVRLAPDGSITSLHYSEMHNDNSINHWHTRSTRRLLYAHVGVNAGHLFMGNNHGITNILNDAWGDHIHTQVYYQPDNSLAVGEWYGLAIDPVSGGLWTCGRYACGMQRFYASPQAWVNGGYQWAFTVFTGNHDLNVPHGYKEDFVGAAVSPNGRAWFLSQTQGLATWDPASSNYSTIARTSVAGLGLPVDVAADPDGTVWVADTTHVIRFDPATGGAQPLTLPSSDIRRLHLDATHSPRALYISTGTGLAIYRGP